MMTGIIAEHEAHIIGIVICAIFIWMYLSHLFKRTARDRCSVPGCDGVRMHVTYYMEPDPGPPSGLFRNHTYETYKFLRCKARGHLRYEVRKRKLSLWAVAWRRVFKFNHFILTKETIELFKELGLDQPGRLKVGGAAVPSKKPVLRVEIPQHPVLLHRSPHGS